MKYAWIRQHRELFSVTAQCQALHVSKSGYYAWVDRLESPHARIHQAVRQVQEEFRSQPTIGGKPKPGGWRDPFYWAAWQFSGVPSDSRVVR